MQSNKHQQQLLREAMANIGDAAINAAFRTRPAVGLTQDSQGNIGIGNIGIAPQSSVPPTNAYLRAQFLDEVEKLVCKDRNVTHGDAEDNFRVIADLWNVYLRNSKGTDNTDDLNNKDVAIMMCLFKISRLMTNINNMENWLDLAGYAACGGGIVKKTVVNTY